MQCTCVCQVPTGPECSVRVTTSNLMQSGPRMVTTPQQYASISSGTSKLGDFSEGMCSAQIDRLCTYTIKL